MEGDIGGTFHVESRANSFDDVMNNPRVNGTFAVGRGLVNGFDLVEAARGGNEGQTRGGQTSFESMSGNLRLEQHVYHVTNLTLSSGLMQASGGLSVADKQVLRGAMNVRLTGTSSAFRAQIHIAGTLTDPQLFARRSAETAPVQTPTPAIVARGYPSL
jgi:hypothetical protein